jgi:tripartite-type tricarboxylate transporter receptor subunit TctC
MVKIKWETWMRSWIARVLICCMGWPLAIWAQDFPTQPMRLIVPFPAGGPADSIARYMGQAMSEAMKQTVVIDNRAGAGGVIGLDMVAKAKPDGYTLGIGSIANIGINVSLMQKMPYDARRDFTPITNGGVTTGVILANAQQPFTDFAGMIEYAKAHPMKLSYATAGIGSVGHMIGESLGAEVGARMTHVPYKGTGPAAQDLLAGVVPLFIETSLATAITHAQNPKIRIIAITRKNRSPLLPQVPALGELGFPELDSPAWFGLVGQAQMPPEVVTKINQVVTQALKTPQAKEIFARFGAEPAPTTPGEFTQYIDREIVRWGNVVKKAQIQPM